MDYEDIFYDEDQMRHVAPTLGAFVMDFNVVDHHVTSLLATLLDGPARYFDSGLFPLLQPLSIGLRVDLLEGVVGMWQSKGAVIDADDLFNDLRYVVSRRNRLLHDYWEVTGLAGANPDDSTLVRTQRYAPGKRRREEEFTNEDLLRLRSMFRHLDTRLDFLEEDINWSEFPTGRWPLIDEIGLVSSRRGWGRAKFREGKVNAFTTHLENPEWLKQQVEATVRDAVNAIEDRAQPRPD